MSILTNFWNNWTTYEKLREGVFLFLIFFITVVAIYYATRDRKITLLSLISLILAAILNVVGIVFASAVLKIQVTEVFRLIPVITSILLLSNLGLLAGFYISKRGKKSFTYENLRVEYLSDTLKQTIFLVLLASAMILFVSVQTQAILAIAVISTLLPVWAIYWLSKYIFK